MHHNDEIVRQRQSAIRREMDRRGIALKVVAFDSGIPYQTLLSYFPQEHAAKPVMMPASAIYSLAEGGALPLDLLSLLLPAGRAIVTVPDDVDHDALADACHEYLRRKTEAHHPASPGGRDIAPCENADLNSKVATISARAA